VGAATQIYWKDFIIKKSVHIIEYAILTMLMYRALRASGVKPQNAALGAIFVSALYGATDEYHQSFTPGREPRVRDIFFDIIGAILAIYGLWNWVDKLPKKIKSYFEKLEFV